MLLHLLGVYIAVLMTHGHTDIEYTCLICNALKLQNLSGLFFD